MTGISVPKVEDQINSSHEAKTLRALASAIKEKQIAVEDRNMWYRKYHRLIEIINQEINQ